MHGCAVEKAIQSGVLDRSQWQSFQKLETETNFAKDKSNKILQREENRRAVRLLQKYKKMKNDIGVL